MTVRVLGCLLVSSIAAADPPRSTRLEMMRRDVPMMLACDDHAREVTHVVVDLRGDRKLEVTSTGRRSEHYARADADETCHEQREAIAWTTRWTGRWNLSGPSLLDTLTLDLVLASDTCTRTQSVQPLPTESVRCSAANKQTRVVCTRDRVGGGELPVWRCFGRGLGASPQRMVFGMAGCVTVSGDRGQVPEHVVECPRP